MIQHLATLLMLLMLGAPQSPAATPLLLTGARVLDPAGRHLLENRSVLIADGHIIAVIADGDLPLPQAENAKRLNLEGLVLLPGLMDLHSHLLLHPYDEAVWNDQVLRESLGLRTIRATVAAKATLAAGFTTLRDLGTEGAGYADVALRDAITQGIIPGPRLVVVTRAIVATGCYGPSGFDPRWTMPKGAQVADGVAGVRRVVREQIAAGADWIKVYADYRRKPGGPATPTFSQEELNALVQEARSAGLRVSAHATTNEAIRRAVRAGVSTIEHGYGASAEVLALMKKHGVALCPTLTAAESMARYAGWRPGLVEPTGLRAAKAMFARALASGVTIACGSDVGVFSHGQNARELELMVACGMSPVQALRSATLVAAEVLGREDDLGRINKGYIADLVAVRDDPLEDITSIRKPAMVFKGGRVVLDKR